MLCSLPSGPLDIVGDVHGERRALEALMAAAGYDRAGRHPEGRTLVFVGDLVDRGPDSPGVVDLVRRLVDAGRALAVLGNHELNLLRGRRRAGNDWFWAEGSEADRRFAPFAQVGAARRAELLAFLDRLPLALTRPDLRVVHAAWHGGAVARLAAEDPQEPRGALFDRLEAEVDAVLAAEGLMAQVDAVKVAWRERLGDPDASVPMLDALGRRDEARQMRHPLRVLTSGLERCATRPFYASGRWRFSERVRWWADYEDEACVVVGHYWRQFQPLDRLALGKGDPDLFSGVAPLHWLGRRQKVFCIDYSVGARWQERREGRPGERTRLAALRWPERELVLETGERFATVVR